eukprot:353608-Chlamydomonas_euryale.AAC.5
MPQLPQGVLCQVDKAVARGQRPMCQKIVESLDHTHSTHRCCRSCLEPHEGLALRGRVSGNSGSACHSLSPCQYPGARPRSALHNSRKHLARHREMPCEKACSWLRQSCALLAAVGSCRCCDISTSAG